MKDDKLVELLSASKSCVILSVGNDAQACGAIVGTVGVTSAAPRVLLMRRSTVLPLAADYPRTSEMDLSGNLGRRTPPEFGTMLMPENVFDVTGQGSRSRLAAPCCLGEVRWASTSDDAAANAGIGRVQLDGSDALGPAVSAFAIRPATRVMDERHPVGTHPPTARARRTPRVHAARVSRAWMARPKGSDGAACAAGAAQLIQKSV